MTDDFSDLHTLNDGDTDESAQSSWERIDLTDAIAGRDIEAPTILERTDGIPLLYPGRVHWFQGESESLKSWLAQYAAAQQLLTGNSVLYIDFEDDERGVAARLLALGVPPNTLNNPEQFWYIRPDEPLIDSHGKALPGEIALAHALETQTWSLAIIDGVTESMTVEGLNLLDNGDIAKWMRRLPKRIANTGTAVAALDHLPKSREQQGRYALGGQHKLAGITGAAYKLTNTAPLGRASNGEATTGTSLITVEKDRPGWIRGHTDNAAIAVLELTAYPDGSVVARILPPDQATTAPPWKLLYRILDHLSIYEGASKGSLENSIEGGTAPIRAALIWMVGKQWIEVRQTGNAHKHYLLPAGRDALNEKP